MQELLNTYLLDIELHTLCSSIIFLIFWKASKKDILLSILITLIIGVLKEYNDFLIRQTYYSWLDILFNINGIIVGYFFTLIYNSFDKSE